MHASHSSGELATMPHVIQRYWPACLYTLKRYAHAGIQACQIWSWRIGKRATNCSKGLASVPQTDLENWQACHTWSWRIGKCATHGLGGLANVPHMVLEDWQACHTWSWRIDKCVTHGPGGLASMPLSATDYVGKHATSFSQYYY